MNLPDPDPSARVSRSDWRTALAWHQQFQHYPVASLLLALLCGVAAAALVLGWVGSSKLRPSDPFRTWAGAALWLAVGVYFAVCGVLGLRARGG
jgi:hypothetical protein